MDSPLAFVATAISGDALAKLLLLALVGAGLLGLGRWSSGFGGRSLAEHPGETPTPDVSTSFVSKKEDGPRVWGPAAEKIAASFPTDPSLGNLSITKFFFEKADAIPGPADPGLFADELHVELFDRDSGHRWEQGFLVATPEGLARILRDRSWRYVYAPEIIVLPRYDLEEIRRAVVSRIVADHEFFKDKPQSEEESL